MTRAPLLRQNAAAGRLLEVAQRTNDPLSFPLLTVSAASSINRGMGSIAQVQRGPNEEAND